MKSFKYVIFLLLFFSVNSYSAATKTSQMPVHGEAGSSDSIYTIKNGQVTPGRRLLFSGTPTDTLGGTGGWAPVIRYWDDWPDTSPGNTLAVGTIVAYDGELYKATQEFVKTAGAVPSAFTTYFTRITSTSGSITGIVYGTSCSGITTGACVDASGDLYYYDGSAVVGPLPTTVPTTLAELNDDATHRLVTDTEKSTWNGKQDDLDVPDQAEAEAGTATTERVWTAQRIAQAIAALAPGGVDEIVYLSDCSAITNGFCIDTDDGAPYYWNGSSVTAISGSGSMTWPSSAGVAVYGGSSAWGDSLTVGTGANNLVQLNASGQLPAVSAALLTNFPTLNQDTTGNALTATTLQTVRTIGGVSFNGSANIDLPGVNIAGNQNTSGTSAGLSGTPDITVQDIYFRQAYSSAADGNRFSAWPNNTVMPNSATVVDGGFTFEHELYGVENSGTASKFLFANDIGVPGGVQAYDANMIQWPSAIDATEIGYLDGLTELLSVSLGNKIGTTGVTFENLNTNSDVGSGSDQVAAGNHTHAGVYEPAGITESDISDLGGTVYLKTAIDTQPEVEAIWGVNIANSIASGTATLGTSEISSGSCATVVSVTGSGVATTDVIDWGFNSDPSGTTGYSAGGNLLYIIAYPTAGYVNFLVCNKSGSAITPGAVTLNWRVSR